MINNNGGNYYIKGETCIRMFAAVVLLKRIIQLLPGNSSPEDGTNLNVQFSAQLGTTELNDALYSSSFDGSCFNVDTAFSFYLQSSWGANQERKKNF